MNYKLLLLFLFTTFTFLPIASAHTVKISGDIGGTIHIEPNDNPRAGEPAATWFALTRKGGKVLPLEECNCQLAVYAEPHTPGEPALLEPSLKSVNAERYQGIPGTTINFPKPGIYELQLRGKPTIPESFQPFELKFQVTVAAGKAAAMPEIVENNIETNQKTSAPTGVVQLLVILAMIFLSIGIVLFFMQKLKTK
jgi:hypothetical protein